MNTDQEQLIQVEIKELLLLELDRGISAYVHERNRRYLNEEQIEIYRRLPKQWFEAADGFLPKTDDELILFEMLSLICPESVFYGNYDTIRSFLSEITPGHWDNLCQDAGTNNIADFFIQRMSQNNRDLEGHFKAFAHLNSMIKRTAEQIQQIYQSVEQAQAFWQWVDVYMEAYNPWRNRQEQELNARKTAYQLLADKQGCYSLETLMEALPRTNALQYRPFLRDLLREKQMPLVMWLEPFGLFDSWSILQGKLIISISPPGALFAHAQEEVEEIAKKGRALGDPTRLGILRIIRHFDMDITEIANYLGVARPTVSVHIKKLREAGLVESYTDGRSTRHRLNTEALREAFDEIRKFLEVE